VVRIVFTAWMAGLAGVPGAALAVAEAASSVSCVASYYHVYIHNDSQTAIEAGSTVEWYVPFTRSTGRHTIRARLQPGSSLLLANALGSDYFTGEGACQASLARAPEAD
jgi:hypothetical protein